MPPAHFNDYQTIYDLVANIYPNQRRFLTISPPHSDEDPECKQRYWLSQLLDLRYCATNVIGVTEFKDERMHFHIVLQVTDPIKYYKLTGRLSSLCNTLSTKHLPKDGFPYFIKDIEDSYLLLSQPWITLPILETLFCLTKAKPKKKKQSPVSPLTRSPTIYDFQD